MAKNRNKKKKNGADMAVDNAAVVRSPRDESQAMDTSETVASSGSVVGLLRKVKTSGRPMKRTKNVRKKKAVARAICKGEKSEEKVSKAEKKTVRTKFAKNLYD